MLDNMSDWILALFVIGGLTLIALLVRSLIKQRQQAAGPVWKPKPTVDQTDAVASEVDNLLKGGFGSQGPKIDGDKEK